MATYDNNLRLKEITPGDEDGTWGGSLNATLEQIGQAWGYSEVSIPSDANQTYTMANGATSAVRNLFLEFTSAVPLTATREVMIDPSTVSKMWAIKNSTDGAQSLTIRQGSGGSVTIPNGETKFVIGDGAGAGGALFEITPQSAMSQITGLAAALADKVDVNTFSQEHSNTTGEHVVVTMLIDGGSQLPVSPGHGRLFVREVVGVPCLFYKNDNDAEIQITSGNSLNVDIPDVVLAPQAVNADVEVSAPVFKGGPFELTVSGGTLTIPLDSGTAFYVDLDQTCDVVFTFDEPKAYSFTLVVNNEGEYEFTSLSMPGSTIWGPEDMPIQPVDNGRTIYGCVFNGVTLELDVFRVKMIQL